MLTTTYLLVCAMCAAACSYCAWTIYRVYTQPALSLDRLQLEHDDLVARFDSLYASHRRLLARVSMRNMRSRRQTEQEVHADDDELLEQPEEVQQDLPIETSEAPQDAAAVRIELERKLAQHKGY